MRLSQMLVAGCLGLALVAPSRRAAADPLPVRSGKVVLPITGLALDLPRDARKNATWMLSGSAPVVAPSTVATSST